MANEQELEAIAQQVEAVKARVPAIQKGVEELKSSPKEAGITADELETTPEFPAVSFDDTTPTTAIDAGAQIGTDSQALIDMAKENQAREDKLRQQQLDLIAQMEPDQTLESKIQELEEEEGLAEKRAQLTAQLAKVAEIRKKIDTLSVQQQQEIDREWTRPVAEFTIRSAIGETNRLYESQKAYLSVQMGYEAAIAQAQQGNINEANKTIDRMANAFVFDLENQRKQYEYIYQFNSDWISALSQERRSMFNMAYQETVRNEENARQDFKDKMSLVIDAANQGADLGLTTDQIGKMSMEELTNFYSQKVSATKGVATTLPGTAGERIRVGEAQERSDIENALTDTLGIDMSKWQGIPYKFPEARTSADLQTYLDLRGQSSMSPSEFDDRFGHFLSPEDQALVDVKIGEEEEVTKRYTAANIPPDIMSDVVDDINRGATLEQLIKEYTEVSTSFLQSTYSNLKY